MNLHIHKDELNTYRIKDYLQTLNNPIKTIQKYLLTPTLNVTFKITFNLLN